MKDATNRNICSKNATIYHLLMKLPTAPYTRRSTVRRKQVQSNLLELKRKIRKLKKEANRRKYGD